MQLINEAYLILKDYEARKRYDKQYYEFQKINQNKQTNNQTKTKWHNYSCNDDILNNWIKKARKQAKDMLMISIDDLVGISKAATNAAWNETKHTIFIVVILNIIIILYFKLFT